MKNLLPTQAWGLLQQRRQAAAAGTGELPLFVDVRMAIESLHVGRPPGVEQRLALRRPAVGTDVRRP